MEISYVTRTTRYIEYISPKGTRVSNSSSHDHILRTEDFLFLVSHESLERNRRLVPRNALSSLFLLFSLFFFLLSLFFPLFQRKAPANGERDGKRGRRGKEETICGGAVARRRANTGQPDFTVSRKTPGSRPIPRSCSVMQVLSASAWILYRAYIYRTG